MNWVAGAIILLALAAAGQWAPIVGAIFLSAVGVRW